MPLLNGTKVVLSSIHGYGVIATRIFRKGEIVIVGDGVLYQQDDDFDDTYSLILDNPKGEDLPPVFYDLACQTRWINHSCDPNTEIESEWDNKTQSMTAWWVATRDIQIGEELAYDYAFTAEVAEPCACKTEKCRGVIVDEDEIEDVPTALLELVRPQYRSKAAS